MNTAKARIIRRLVCVLLAALVVFVMVGCGKEKRQIIKLTLSTEDSEAILAAAGIMLPDAESAKGAGTTGNNPQTWAQLKEQYMESIEYYLEDLNDWVQNPDARA